MNTQSLHGHRWPLFASLIGLALAAGCDRPVRDRGDTGAAILDGDRSAAARPMAAGGSLAALTPGPSQPLTADAGGTSPRVPVGGLLDLNLRTADREHPFMGRARIVGGGRALWLSSLVGGTRIVGVALVDVGPSDAMTAGPIDLRLDVEDVAAGHRVHYALPQTDANVPQIDPRPVVALTLGGTRTGETLFTPRGSNLYGLTTTADDQVVQLRFATEGALVTAALAGAVAPASGRFADGQFFYASQTTGMAQQTALLWAPRRGAQTIAVFAANLTGAPDARYAITARAASLRRKSAREGAIRDSAMAPLWDVMLDGAYAADDAAIDGRDDVDYVRVQPMRDGRLYAQATVPGQGLGGDLGLGLSVTWMAADCVTPVAGARPLQQEVSATAGKALCAVIRAHAGYVGAYGLLVSPEL